MFFIFYKFIFFFSDFLEIQRKSFYSFLNDQLGEEFSKINPLVNSRKLTRKNNNTLSDINNISNEQKTIENEENFFYSSSHTNRSKAKNNSTTFWFLYRNYKFTAPNPNIEQCIASSKTYCCNFYIPVQLYDYSTNFSLVQWVFLGTLPLLTRRGHFIINGTPRVILNQIIRSPGIYFKKKNSQRLYAEIISKRGPWVRLEIDKKKRFWIYIQQNNILKIPLSFFLKKLYIKNINQFFFESKKIDLNLTLINKLLEKNTPKRDLLQNDIKINTWSNSLTSNYFKNLSKKNQNSFNFILIKLKNKFKFSILSYKNTLNICCPFQFYKYILFIKKLDDKINFFINNKNKSFNNKWLKKFNQLIENRQLFQKNNKSKETKFQRNSEINPSVIFGSSPKKADLTFYLGQNGRNQLNKRLGLSLKTLSLTPVDFLTISNILFQLTKNNEIIFSSISSKVKFDDIDDLKNRRLKSIGELLQNQLSIGLQRLQRNFENDFKNDSLKKINKKTYNSSLLFLKFFGLKQKKIPTKTNRKNIYNKLPENNFIDNEFFLPVGKTSSQNFNLTNKKIQSKQINEYKTYSFLKRDQFLNNIKKLNNLQLAYSIKNKTEYLSSVFPQNKLLLITNKLNFKRYFLWKDVLLFTNQIKKVKKKINSDLILTVFNSQPINSVFKEFFHSHQLSQYLDQSNSLAEITHKRRLSCLGSGGINRETAGMEIRGIHITHYGRICPIETPEGKNAGLVNSLTTSANINKNGFLETPFIEVYKKHLQNQKKIFFFSMEHQEKKKFFFSHKLPKSKNVSVGIVQSQTKNFNKCKLNFINFLAISPQQFISIATNCIPFIEHNDANRALMGSNMQRQALPLLNLEQPFVTTFNTSRIFSDLKDIPISIKSGIVLYTSQQYCYIYRSEKKNLINVFYKKKNFSFYEKRIIFSLNLCHYPKIYFNF